MWTENFKMFKLDLEKAGEPEIKLPTPLDHWKSKRVPEKHLLLLYWHCQSLGTCSVQSLSRVQLFATPCTEAHQASLSITNSWSLLRLMSIESVMPSKHLIFCCPLILLPLIFPSFRVFSNESALCIRYWSFSFNINPSNEHSGLISLRWTGWISLQSKWLSTDYSNTTVQNHQFFGAQLYSQTLTSIHGHWKNHRLD